MIQQMFGDLPSHSQHTAGVCSWPYQSAQSCSARQLPLKKLEGGSKAEVHVLNDVGADGGSEHGGHGMCFPAGFAIAASNTDSWTDRHNGYCRPSIADLSASLFVDGCWTCGCRAYLAEIVWARLKLCASMERV